MSSPQTTLFIEPLDVLFLRGNKLFGDPGSHGEALIPPWPSVAAGALRSRMLADAGIDLAAFARGDVAHPTLGTPQAPGLFAVTAFHLARRHADGRVEALMALPADLVVHGAGADLQLRRLLPHAMAAGVSSSASLPQLPVLAEAQRGKPAAGTWLAESGWRRYLAGELPRPADLVASSALWQIDHRVGVGLDAQTQRAADGQLFSMQAVALARRHGGTGFDVGFVLTVEGAEPPAGGMLRLGGDGRAAALHAVDHRPPEPDLAAIAQARRCRLVLASPGLFVDGWRPTGVDAEGRFALHGVRARLVCAAVPRAEVVSGWDLARQQPKDAWRAVPAGSVYWLDDIETDAQSLRKLAAHGLQVEGGEHAQRRAEGFNRLHLAAY